jgi:hypothetical protein
MDTYDITQEVEFGRKGDVVELEYSLDYYSDPCEFWGQDCINEGLSIDIGRLLINGRPIAHPERVPDYNRLETILINAFERGLL